MGASAASFTAALRRAGVTRRAAGLAGQRPLSRGRCGTLDCREAVRKRSLLGRGSELRWLDRVVRAACIRCPACRRALAGVRELGRRRERSGREHALNRGRRGPYDTARVTPSEAEAVRTVSQVLLVAVGSSLGGLARWG